MGGAMVEEEAGGTTGEVPTRVAGRMDLGVIHGGRVVAERVAVVEVEMASRATPGTGAELAVQAKVRGRLRATLFREASGSQGASHRCP